MSKYDLILISVMISSMVLILNGLAFGFFTEWLNLWYLILVPFALLKIFSKNNKIDKWLNEKL